jgi:enamine deaminase RidA (YjgF/YER057c/UK114 family)
VKSRGTRRLISSGSDFEQLIGYSRAVVQNDWIFVSGTTGFDYAAMTISDSLEEQTEQCLLNIRNALDAAGADFRRLQRPKAATSPACRGPSASQ